MCSSVGCASWVSIARSPGTRHQFMVYRNRCLAVPSSAEFSVPQLRLMLHENDINFRCRTLKRLLHADHVHLPIHRTRTAHRRYPIPPPPSCSVDPRRSAGSCGNGRTRNAPLAVGGSDAPEMTHTRRLSNACATTSPPASDTPRTTGAGRCGPRTPSNGASGTAPPWIASPSPSSHTGAKTTEPPPPFTVTRKS